MSWSRPLPAWNREHDASARHDQAAMCITCTAALRTTTYVRKARLISLQRLCLRRRMALRRLRKNKQLQPHRSGILRTFVVLDRSPCGEASQHSRLHTAPCDFMHDAENICPLVLCSISGMVGKKGTPAAGPRRALISRLTLIRPRMLRSKACKQRCQAHEDMGACHVQDAPLTS